MTIEQIHEEINELRTIVEAQTDLLGVLTAYGASVTAQLETVLSLQRDALVKMGLDRESVQQASLQTLAHHLVVAQQTLARAVSSSRSTRPPSASGPETRKN